MARESIAERKARLQRELDALEQEHSSSVDKVLDRANGRIKSAIDKEVDELADAAEKLGDDVDKDVLRSRLYERYNIEGGSDDPPAGDPPADDPPADDPPADDPPPDEKPPGSHWSERKIFGGRR